MVVYLNGAFVELSEAKLSVNDRGFLYGDGVFETIRAYDGVPFRLREHLLRLLNSCRTLGLAVNVESMPGIVERLLKLNALRDAYVRITVTGGMHRGKLTARSGESTVAVLCRKLEPPPNRWYERGVEAVFASIRVAPDFRRHKAISYLASLIAKNESRRRGAHEAILLNTRGDVAEGSTTNVFVLRNKQLITPPLDCGALPGITRAVVMELAPSRAIPLKIERLRPEELMRADEVFLTNSLVELLPVVRIEGRAIGEGTPGEVYGTLLRAYREKVAEEKGGTR